MSASELPSGRITQRNWPSLIVIVLLLGWIGLVSPLVHWLVWITEQFFLIESADWPAWVWPVAASVHGLLLIVPLVPLAWFWRVPRYRAVFRTWALMALFLIFLLPVRLVPSNDAQLAGLLQILGAGLYLVFVAALIWVRRLRGGTGFVRPRGPYLPALLFPPLLAWTWLAWGALGSALDTFLNLAAGLLLGLGAGLVVGHFLLGSVHRTSRGPSRDIALSSLAIGAGLLIMGSGLGWNGQQLFAAPILACLGGVIGSLGRLGREREDGSWLALSLSIGLIAAIPLALMDPDELALVLNLGSRDVLQWSAYAAIATMGSEVMVGLLLFLLRHQLPRWRNRAVLGGTTGMVWLAGVLIYLFAGQPGLHGESLYVVLADQADVTSAVDLTDYGQRRQYVYDTLVDHAQTSQAGIRAVLDRLGIDYTPYYLVNAIEVEAGPLMRLWLRSHSQVDRVLEAPVLRPLPAPIPPARGSAAPPVTPQWNLTSVGADRVWAEFGVRGEGIVVGLSDSGAQWDHPELKVTYRGWENGGAVHDHNWYDPWYHTTEPTDTGGHGTHTLGSILGQSVGVAPGATWYGCSNLARNLANPALYLDCLQFMLAPYPLDGDPMTDGEPSLGAHVINNSWGCPELEGCDPNALVDAIGALRAAGVFVVASAGNEGERCETVDYPIALYDEAFSVGAVDSSGRLAYFSSRGPVTADGSGRTKPDIIAPGVNVLSAYPGDTYEYADGTSMAGPHVVGVVALVWSANPDLIGDIERTEQILAETAKPYDYAQHGYPNCAGDAGTPNNAVGYGIVDAYAAVQRALEMDQAR